MTCLQSSTLPQQIHVHLTEGCLSGQHGELALFLWRMLCLRGLNRPKTLPKRHRNQLTLLGPPAVPFYSFFREASPTIVDETEKTNI